MTFNRVLAVSSVGIVVGLMLIAVAVTSLASDAGGIHGHGSGSMMETSLTGIGWIIVTIGIIIVISLVFLAVLSGTREVKGDVEPFRNLAVAGQGQKEASRIDLPPESPSKDVEVASVPFEQMALRLLEGDERRVYRKVVESGGEILQKDIVTAVLFSKAKVSRIIDKLENKGLVSKERYGYTNRIVLKRTQ